MCIKNRGYYIHTSKSSAISYEDLDENTTIDSTEISRIISSVGLYLRHPPTRNFHSVRVEFQSRITQSRAVYMVVLHDYY